MAAATSLGKLWKRVGALAITRHYRRRMPRIQATTRRRPANGMR